MCASAARATTTACPRCRRTRRPQSQSASTALRTSKRARLCLTTAARRCACAARAIARCRPTPTRRGRRAAWLCRRAAHRKRAIATQRSARRRRKAADCRRKVAACRRSRIAGISCGVSTAKQESTRPRCQPSPLADRRAMVRRRRRRTKPRLCRRKSQNGNATPRRATTQLAVRCVPRAFFASAPN